MSKSTRSGNTTVGAFVLNNSAEYSWVVYVFVPKPNGGGKLKTKFKATFRHVSQERRLEILEDFRKRLEAQRTAAQNPQDEDQVSAARDLMSYQRALLDEALVSFSGVVDADGNEMPCTDESRTALLDNSWAQDALMGAYVQSLVGRSDEGN